MARIVKSLNDTQLRSAKPKLKEYSLPDGKGLFLRVLPNGNKKWIFNYTKPFVEKRTNLGLGSYPELSLSQAREIRENYNSLLASNIDPKEYRISIEQQKTESYSNTLHEVAKKWYAIKANNLKEMTIKKDWERMNKHLFPKLGHIPVNQITARLAIEELKYLSEEKKFETLHKMIRKLNQILNFAVNSDLLAANPCIKIADVFPKIKVKSNPTITINELPQLLKDIEHTKEIQERVKLLIYWQLLTVVRPAEAVSVKWDQIDFKNKEWNIPAENMKGRKGYEKAHIVPLSNQSIEILEKAKEYACGSDYVFYSRVNIHEPMSKETVNNALKRIGYKDRLTAHGIRSLFSSTANDSISQTGFNPDAIEACLAHKVGDGVRAIYNRATYFEDRKIIMGWWGDFY